MYQIRIVFIFVALILIYTPTTANAYSFSYLDVPKEHPAYYEIVRLHKLGITQGYPDGNYRPEETITRAEIAKLVVVAAGLKDLADSYRFVQPPFIDVGIGAWYTGWINLAALHDLMEGDSNTAFRPNDMSTYEEVIFSLLRLLGYDDNLPGERPVDYIAKAAALGFFEDMQFSVTDHITRGDLAILLSRTMDQSIVNYHGTSNSFLNSPDKTTLLIENFFKPKCNSYFRNYDSDYIVGLAAIAKLIR